MINIARCFHDPRAFKAVTGMTISEFTALFPAFLDALHQPTTVTPRRRQPGGGRKHPLTTGREKLFFLLCYVTCYATVDVLAWLFDVDRAHTSRWVTTCLPG